MSKLPSSFTDHVTRAAWEEDGALTAFGIYSFLAAAVISAIALDVANLMSAKNQLQVAADTAAHAALYYRDEHDADISKEKAIEAATFGMPSSNYGVVLDADDIQYGDWDYETLTFTPNDTSRNATLVTTSRMSDKSNSVASLLFQLVGMSDFDVVNSAVFATFRPTCFREGIVGDDIVDIQSNNGFSNGFCLHSNTHVEVNNNNTFEAGTIVSMPNEDDLVLPRSGFELNDGLQAALRSGYYRPRILDKMEDIFEILQDEFATDTYGWVPDYITYRAPISLDSAGTTLDETDFTVGRIHTKHCTGSGKVTISPSVPLEEIVFISDCETKISNGSVLINVVIATTDTSSTSINTPSSLQVGDDDNCAPGGGAQLLTMGGMKFAAGLMLYGGQLIAQGDIDFTANADGIEGASMVAGGMVDGESNMEMAFCGTGMEDNYVAEYFRLAL